MHWGAHVGFAVLGMQYRFVEDCEGFLPGDVLGDVTSAVPTPHVVMAAFRTAMDAGHERCVRALATAFGEDGDEFEDVLFFAADTARNVGNVAYLDIVLQSYHRPSAAFLELISGIAVSAAENDQVAAMSAILAYIRNADEVLYHTAHYRATAAAIEAGRAASFLHLWRDVTPHLKPVIALQSLTAAASAGDFGIVSALMMHINDLSPVAGTVVVRSAIRAATERGNTAIVALLTGAFSRPRVNQTSHPSKDRTD